MVLKFAATSDAKNNELSKPAEVVCMADIDGNQAKGQTAMENCLQKKPDINVRYTINVLHTSNVLHTINGPAAAGACNALKKAGKDKSVIIVSVDGGCDGIKDVASGTVAATSQQYPLKLASRGVEAGVEDAKSGKSGTSGKKVSGDTDTGVTLIANTGVAGVDSRDAKVGADRGHPLDAASGRDPVGWPAPVHGGGACGGLCRACGGAARLPGSAVAAAAGRQRGPAAGLYQGLQQPGWLPQHAAA